jgi:hypothetical protein
MGSSSRDSYRELFKKLPLLYQYIFSLLLCVVENRELFRHNSDAQNINARYNSDLHLPTENLTVLQKGVFYFGIKSF